MRKHNCNCSNGPQSIKARKIYGTVFHIQLKQPAYSSIKVWCLQEKMLTHKPLGAWCKGLFLTE